VVRTAGKKTRSARLYSSPIVVARTIPGSGCFLRSVAKRSYYEWAAIRLDESYVWDQVGVYFRTADGSTPATTTRSDALQLVDRQVAYGIDHDRLPLAFQFIAVKSQTEAHPHVTRYDGVALLKFSKFLVPFVPR
jgi:hypothetical protein